MWLNTKRVRVWLKEKRQGMCLRKRQEMWLKEKRPNAICGMVDQTVIE